jgi:hypothetical protein
MIPTSEYPTAHVIRNPTPVHLSNRTRARVQLGIFAVLVVLMLGSILAWLSSIRTAHAQMPSVVTYGADPTGKQDSTHAFQSALLAHPAGRLYVPAQPNGSPATYRISAPLHFTRKQGLVGAGAGAVTLTCTSLASPCVTFADTISPVLYAIGSLEGLSISGPGTDNASIGLYLGGDPAGNFSPADAYAPSVSLQQVIISGFHTGIQWGNNAWSNRLIGSEVLGCNTGLYVPSGLKNSGEEISVIGSTIANNTGFGINDAQNFEWEISDSAFDYNAVAINLFGASLHVTNTHFEQEAGPFVRVPYGSPDLFMVNNNFLLNATGGNDKAMLDLYPQHYALVIDGARVFANHPVANFVFAGGSPIGRIADLFGNGNGKIASVVQAGVPSELSVQPIR